MGRNEQCVIVLRSVLLFIHRETTFTNAGGGGGGDEVTLCENSAIFKS